MAQAPDSPRRNGTERYSEEEIRRARAWFEGLPEMPADDPFYTQPLAQTVKRRSAPSGDATDPSLPGLRRTMRHRDRS